MHDISCTWRKKIAFHTCSQFVLIREVTTEHASDVVGMISASGKVLVAIAQEKGDVVGGGGRMERSSARVVVLAYSKEKGQYFVVQHVQEYGVTGLTTFTLHGKVVLFEDRRGINVDSFRVADG